MKPIHIIPVNASSLKLLTCPQKYAFRVQHGLVPQVDAEALWAGKLIHRFAELIETGISRAKAEMQVINESTNVPENFSDIVTQYTLTRGRWPAIVTMPDGQKMVEYFFNFPWKTYEREHCTYEIHVCGTMDRVCFSDGKLRILDIKTTKKSSKDDIFDAYEHSVQFYFYQWVLQEWGESMFHWDKDLFRAVTERNIVTQILMVQRFNGKWILGPERFHDSRLMVRWLKEFERVVEGLVDAHEEQRKAQVEGREYEPPKTGLINDVCGYCEYVPICHAPDRETGIQRASMGFEYREYNPSKF